MKLRRLASRLMALMAVLAIMSCYHRPAHTPDGWQPSTHGFAAKAVSTEELMDSLSFYTTHHYTENYNFVVTADSMPIVRQMPMEIVGGMVGDTTFVYNGDRLVVADILTLKADTVDTVWVQVARDELTIGWLHEGDLLTAVSPDNPVSRFIDFFSDTHQLILLAAIVPTLAILLIVRLMRRRAPMVHLNDIPSFYPTLLVITIATSAVLYNTIQLSLPQMWRHFYYHPTLNPFALPTTLGIFVASVWTMAIVAIAVLDDIRRQPTADALLYSIGLIAVGATAYVLFTIVTLAGAGWPLLALYVAFAIIRYVRHARPRFVCGHCQQPIRNKGICPYCGNTNE